MVVLIRETYYILHFFSRLRLNTPKPIFPSIDELGIFDEREVLTVDGSILTINLAVGE